MSEVAHGTQREFWRPPIIHQETGPARVLIACGSCGAEFVLGAQFCHVCGTVRALHRTSGLGFLRALEFHNIMRWLGLSTLPLIALVAGLGCLVATVLVGTIYSAQNLADFQAIQLWRIQWLLAAVAAFLAALLLKKTSPRQK